QLRIGAKGASETGPSWLGGKVRLRKQRHVDAHRAVLATHQIREAAHGGLITDGGKAQWLGPLRESASGLAGADHGLEMVPGIGAEGHRDAQPRARRDLLERIVLARELAR